MKNKNMIVGLLAVGVIAGVALLLGTDKGKKLSKKLSKKGKEKFEEYKEKMNQYVDSKA
ncbi:MAG: hypothetical protein H7258_11645 [Ferruginibacter sp.]|nr:hypothetical protein [Ferruginibacter sp.]